MSGEPDGGESTAALVALLQQCAAQPLTAGSSATTAAASKALHAAVDECAAVSAAQAEGAADDGAASFAPDLVETFGAGLAAIGEQRLDEEALVALCRALHGFFRGARLDKALPAAWEFLSQPAMAALAFVSIRRVEEAGSLPRAFADYQPQLSLLTVHSAASGIGPSQAEATQLVEDILDAAKCASGACPPACVPPACTMKLPLS